MRCSVKGCNVVCKHPQKAMCWKDFDMCKYHAFEFYPDAYDVYRPVSDKFGQLCKKLNIE